MYKHNYFNIFRQSFFALPVIFFYVSRLVFFCKFSFEKFQSFIIFSHFVPLSFSLCVSLQVSGDNPVFVESVKPGGAAQIAGLVAGDMILKACYLLLLYLHTWLLLFLWATMQKQRKDRPPRILLLLLLYIVFLLSFFLLFSSEQQTILQKLKKKNNHFPPHPVRVLCLFMLN